MPPVSTLKPAEPFDLFFRDRLYLECKRNFYSFLRRKDEIARFVSAERGILLEVGSGTAPITPAGPRSVYSDISQEAMRYLREVDGLPATVVFNSTGIPIRDNSIQTVVCSEVIEHIDDDRTAIKEMHRVLAPGGELILTVPVHGYYFSLDDRFVEHKRRYEIAALVELLSSTGFTAFTTAKVAGPLEKITTIAAVLVFRLVSVFFSGRGQKSGTVLEKVVPLYVIVNRLYAKLIRFDARLMPQFLSTIILIHCRKAR